MRIAKGEHGSVFSPPRVPLSASRANEVVNVRILAKKVIIQSVAAPTSGLVPIAPPLHAKLQISMEPTEKVRMDSISYDRLNSALRSFSAILNAALGKSKIPVDANTARQIPNPGTTNLAHFPLVLIIKYATQDK